MILTDFFHEISDTLFPPLCLSCTEVLPFGNRQGFCSECLNAVTFIHGGSCPVCGVIFPDSPAGDHLCVSCLGKRPWFMSARAAVVYDGVIHDAIHRFKYGRNVTTGAALARILADFYFKDVDFGIFDAIVPVPLHVKRLRQRGFNQSLILARALAEKHGLNVDFSLLKRRKLTLTQTGLDKKERERNIAGAFVVDSPQKIRDKNLILVDDVYTTGATVNECAGTLVEAGARQVAVITLARVL